MLIKPVYENEIFIELYAKESEPVKRQCHVCKKWLTIPANVDSVVCDCGTKVYRS